jgi:hypothetical protein
MSNAFSSALLERRDVKRRLASRIGRMTGGFAPGDGSAQE